jgi:hypothetical protein
LFRALGSVRVYMWVRVGVEVGRFAQGHWEGLSQGRRLSQGLHGGGMDWRSRVEKLGGYAVGTETCLILVSVGVFKESARGADLFEGIGQRRRP